MSVWTAVRVGAGALLAVSGFEKLVSPYQNFLFVIEQYKVIGGEPAVRIAQGLPWAELITGVFLALGLWTRAAGVAALGLFGTFILVVGQALLRGLPMDECGCFGELISIPLPAVLAMDVTLAVLILAGLSGSGRFRAFSLDGHYDGR